MVRFQGSDRRDFAHVGNIMFEHVSIHFGRSRTTASAGAAQQIDHTVLEFVEDDIAAIHGHCGADAGVEQIFDLGDDFAVSSLLLAASVSRITGDRR